MRKAYLAAAGAIALAASGSLPAEAGEIILGGWFYPSFDVGYVNNNYYDEAGDTSGMLAADPIYFSNSAILPLPKTLTFDSPVYGDVSATYNILDYDTYTSAGEFYQFSNASGEWLDVNIVLPGHGISSFSFVDFATAAPPPPCTDCDPPPPCLTCDPPPPPITGAPEASTWVMMLTGFAGLGYAATRKARTARLAA